MKSICAKKKHNFSEGENCAMCPSEDSVHYRTGDKTQKVLQTQRCFTPLTVFKSQPRSEFSPDPGSAHDTSGEDKFPKLPKQTNNNYEIFTACQGGL